jgi:hypothetical protein
MTVTFDGVDLITTTYTTRFVKHESVADRDISLAPLAREDGQVFISDRYGAKTIKLQGTIKGSSQSDLEQKIDTFTELFSRPQKQLDIDFAGGTRRYIATCAHHEFDRDFYHLSIAPWTAEFIVPSGVGKDTTTTQPTAADGDTLNFDPSNPITSAATSFTILGSKAPKPVVTLGNLTFGSAVKGIEYKNTDTGQRLIITYPGTWGSSRSITIDFEAKTVTGDVVDGVIKPLNFYGEFPDFKIGTNHFSITPGGIVNQKSADDLITDTLSSSITIQATSDYKAQSFMVPYHDETFKGIVLGVNSQGTPGNMTWRIETDNGGKPSGTLVSADATGTIGLSDMTTSLSYVTDYSTNPFTLEANTLYWLVLKAGATLNGTNRYFLGLSKNATYARGRARYSVDTGSTWTDFTDKTDLMFRLLMGGSQASVSVDHTVTYYKTYL